MYTRLHFSVQPSMNSDTISLESALLAGHGHVTLRHQIHAWLTNIKFLWCRLHVFFLSLSFSRLIVPSVSVSGLEVSLVTNTTAVLRWRPPIHCWKLSGPASKFAWELHRDESGTMPATTTTTDMPLTTTMPSTTKPHQASSQPLRSGVTSAMVIMLR